MRLVGDGARLVTLTGPGGVGKTRLLVEVAGRLAAVHPDGTVQVALAPVLDPGEVVPSLARALGLPGREGPDGLAELEAAVGEQRLLLVLDNLEHLLPAAGHVSHLVAACPSVTVLVSSRAPLRVRGETEHVVAPLGLPVGQVRTELDLAASPAGALRAGPGPCGGRSRAPGTGGASRAGPAELQALAELCRRLAGLPLAIELATARLRLLDPPTLLARLEELPPVVGARDLPVRQRTMRATLDWSYGLLSPDERTVLRLVGAFRCPATLEAVEAVAGPEVPAGQVVGLLAALVEHSLVQVRTGPDGERRFAMLEPVAQYARSLLVDEEGARAARRHAAVALALAEQAAVGYEREEQVAWLARTEAVEADLLVAVERSLLLDDVRTAGGLVWALWLYWWLRGQPSTGRRLAEHVLAAAEGRPLPDDLRARVHLTAATMSFAAGDVAAAGRHWDAALGLAAEHDDPDAASKARAGTGLAAMASGDLAAAEERFRAALPLAARAGEQGVWLASLVHVWLGTVLLSGGDLVGAVEQTGRGLALARGRGDRLSTYVALYGLARVAVAGGDPASARGHLEEGIRLSVQTGDWANLAYFLDMLVVVEAADGAPGRVALLLGAAQSLRETVGSNVYGYYLPDDAARDAAAARARAELGDDAYDDALDAGRALEPHEVAGVALAGQG